MTDETQMSASEQPKPEPPAQQTQLQQQTESKVFTQDEVNRVVGERLAREREKFADYSELKERSAKLAEIEEQNKTAEEKRQEELAAARWDLESATTELLRYRAANKFGVDEENISLITGSDEESVMASAERIGKLLADSRRLEELQQAPKTQQHTTGRPVDNLRPGATAVEQQISDLSYPAEWFPGHRQ